MAQPFKSLIIFTECFLQLAVNVAVGVGIQQFCQEMLLGRVAFQLIVFYFSQFGSQLDGSIQSPQNVNQLQLLSHATNQSTAFRKKAKLQ